MQQAQAILACLLLFLLKHGFGTFVVELVFHIAFPQGRPEIRPLIFG
ncbi:MAG: hypothetical protein M3436_20430 [Pseudomonadota bacterium]|nr:hypothetical protein [Pseudomonadota bacterium]